MPRARHYDPDQPVVREGEVEYITLRNGRRHEVRRWKTGSRDWQYTALGRRFFSRERTEWLIEVPVEVRGRRRDDQGEYSKNTWVPVSFLGLPAQMTPAMMMREEAQERLKPDVLEQAGKYRMDGGELVLYEFSNEVFVYDEEREWRMSTLTTYPGGPGRAGPPPRRPC
jgi:hypothetical protein